jgi:hypothetical protein
MGTKGTPWGSHRELGEHREFGETCGNSVGKKKKIPFGPQPTRKKLKAHVSQAFPLAA